MSKDSVSDWDTTAANNTDIGGINIQGSASIANGDNAMRAFMAQLASYFRRGADLASAGTLDLDSVDSLFLDITGTVTVTGVTLTSGHVRICRATGAFQITAGASLIVNGSTSTNYVCAINDFIFFEGYGSSVVRVSVIGGPGARATRGLLHGLTLSNNATDATNDIDIAVGQAASESTNPILMVLGTAMTKRLDADWSAGTGNGMRNSAAAVANTTYHIYLVAKAGGADVDIYAHTSATASTALTALQAETGGGSYVYARRIGAIQRVSAAILEFVQHGDSFRLKTPILDTNATNPGTSAVTRSLSVPISINVVAHVIAELIVTAGDGINSALYLSDPAQTDMAPSSTAAPLAQIQALLQTSSYAGSWSGGIRTNTSGHIRSRLSGSAANTVLRIATIGWDDNRGRTF